jgi:predicted nucleic acid-binding protein
VSRAFFDSNILLYSVNKDDTRRLRATDVLMEGGIVSVQCLNEFASVARRKLGLSWEAVADAREQLLVYFERVVPLSLRLHEQGLLLAQRYGLSVYDGLIVGAALAADCDILWSEDMHHGLLVHGRLRIINPFAPTL